MKRRRRQLPEFDKYAHYMRAVQSPDVDAKFIQYVYKQLRGKPARFLREDFCGTFAICCEWAKANPANRALGLDLDLEPLEYGRQNYLTQLKPQQQKRVETVRASVLTADVAKADVVAAMNFSFYLFKSRLMLRQYFTRVLRGLKSKGILICDAFGGPACWEAVEDVHNIAGFKYYWEQVGFNPISHEALFHIHFKRKGEAKRQKVFTYDWRMWTIPEIREAMMEAGFRRTNVYWEGSTRNGKGNGIFKRSEKGEECDAFVAYIAGEA